MLTGNAWFGAELRRLIERTPNGDRSREKGPAISLEPQAAVSLSLVLYELATNVAKYGAFSGHGRVELAWRLLPGDQPLGLSRA